MLSNNPYGVAQVKRSLIHFIFGKGLTAIVGFTLLLLVVRALPASDYGVYVVLLATLEIMQLASNFGLISAAYRYVPEQRSQNQGVALHRLLVWLSVLRLSTLLATAAIIIVCVKPITDLLNLNGFEHVISIYALVVVTEGFARYLDIIFDSLLLQRYSQVGVLFRNGLRLAGLIAAIQINNWNVSLANWVIIELLASLLGALLSTLMLFRFSLRLRIKTPGTIRNDVGTHRFLIFAVPSYLAQIIGLAYGPETTKLILTRIVGVLEVGAFGFAASISAMLQRYLPVFLLLGLVRPLFVSTHDSFDRNQRLNQLSGIVLKLNIFVLFPLIAFIFTSGDQLAKLLSGGKFPDAGNFLIIFIVLMLFQTWHAVLSLVTLALEDGVSGLYGTVLGLAGLFTGIACVRNYGSFSLCVGLLLSEIIWCAYVTFSLYRRGLSIQNDWIGVVKIFAFSLAGWAVSALFNQIYALPETATIFMKLITISLIFVVLAYFIKPFTKEERSLINRILPRPVFVW